MKMVKEKFGINSYVVYDFFEGFGSGIEDILGVFTNKNQLVKFLKYYLTYCCDWEEENIIFYKQAMKEVDKIATEQEEYAINIILDVSNDYMIGIYSTEEEEVEYIIKD